MSGGCLVLLGVGERMSWLMSEVSMVVVGRRESRE